jgi:hypothetical protein
MTTVVLTGVGVWSLPADWNDAANTIEIYGAGGTGATGTAGRSGGGGGGGAYVKATNIPLRAAVNSGAITAQTYNSNTF